MDQPPPPSPVSPAPSASGASFLVLAVSIVGILTTSVLLLGYYLFITKGRFFFLLSRWPRRRGDADDDDDRLRLPVVYSPAVAAKNAGLDQAVIAGLPTFRYNGNYQRLRRCDGAEGAGIEGSRSRCEEECAVCLSEFEEEQRVKLLPGCCHVFHVDCIDAWLQSAASCPLCRAPINEKLLWKPVAVVPPTRDHNSHAVLSVGRNREPSGAASERKKLPRMISLGDVECLVGVALRSGGAEVEEDEDDSFNVQPVRRSLSMDSCSDKHLYLAVQQILQQKVAAQVSSSSGEPGSAGWPARTRRSFFSFSQSLNRSSRRAVLPV